MSDEFTDCPKCRGGCNLCGGSGQVRLVVARVWIREETRTTTKMNRTQPFPDELPTKPDVIKRANKRARVVRLIAIGILGAVTGIGLGLAAALLLQ